MPYVCMYIGTYIYTYVFMNMIKIQLVCEKSNVLGGRRQLPSTVVSLFFAVLPSLSADKDGNGIHSQKPSQRVSLMPEHDPHPHPHGRAGQE